MLVEVASVRHHTSTVFGSPSMTIAFTTDNAKLDKKNGEVAGRYGARSDAVYLSTRHQRTRIAGLDGETTIQ